jgi:hypothetical protein
LYLGHRAPRSAAECLARLGPGTRPAFRRPRRRPRRPTPDIKVPSPEHRPPHVDRAALCRRVPSPSERERCQVGPTNVSWPVHGKLGVLILTLGPGIRLATSPPPAPPRTAECRAPSTGTRTSTAPRFAAECRARLSEKRISGWPNRCELARCIPVGIQREKAGFGPSSGPTWRLSHSGPRHPPVDLVAVRATPDSTVPSPEPRAPPADHAAVAEPKPRHRHPRPTRAK